MKSIYGMNTSATSILPIISLFLILTLFSCTQEPASFEGPQFTLVSPADSKISFKNTITETPEFNFINYLNMYNGGGVGLGDINNDGLLDVYLTANQSSNKLYLNKGNMVFEDITDASGTADALGWSTGVTMVDINSDGWLDIYVCKSASVSQPELRKNKLFINQKNNTFVDQAEAYGLADAGLSTQAYFFDYDRDGDLDVYLVTQRADFENSIVLSAAVAKNIIPEFSDRLYKNNSGRFTDVTAEAGMINKTFGHSASIHDFNEDGWPDVYVCNDFIEPDHLYINNHDGTFTDKILTTFDHISMYSMGSDVADVNNDGKFDLTVMDMVSEDHVRNKKNMPGMSSKQFNTMAAYGYHHQYMCNMMQMSRGDNTYSEVAYMSGIANTDWSWAPLFADFDNDGYKDLFVTNGIKRDMTNNDYKNKLNELSASGSVSLEEIFTIAPAEKIANYMFRNKGDESFENVTASWGLDQKINSNGVAYGDLDNDGDLDLVVNNIDDFASVYENHASNNFLRVRLKGPGGNISGIGSTVSLEAGGMNQYLVQQVSRGYQSSVDKDLHFGLGKSAKAEKVTVVWPDGKSQTLTNVSANKVIEFDHKNAERKSQEKNQPERLFAQVNTAEMGLDFTHIENEYDDFQSEILLPYRQSTLGPNISAADVNGDGLIDFYVSGAQDMAGALMIQSSDGSFTKSNTALWVAEKRYEDIGSVFFDLEGDGDMDLYVVSGGNEANRPSANFTDRLYLNDGKGNFTKSSGKIPDITTSGGRVVAGDFDGDGDTDILVCGRLIPGKYPLPASSYLLENTNGILKDVTAEKAPQLKEIGMVTDAAFSDFDGDGDLDITLVGEWMPFTVFEQKEGVFTSRSFKDESGIGWWFSITPFDVDGDGDEDYIVGNLGLNNKYGGKKEKPFHVFCNDFDNTGNLDIVLSKESKGKLLPVRGRECSSQQMPFIKEKFPTFTDFAEADLEKIYGKEKLENAVHYVADNFQSGIMVNDGKGHFTFTPLPKKAQYGPTLKTIVADVNGDGQMDIIGGGNIYEAEVETIRFDASKGYVLLGDGKGNFTFRDDSGLKLDGSIKDMTLVQCKGRSVLLAVANSGPLKAFELKG